ncbi:TPA: hypothetical protein ACNVDX_000267 [Citrobacter gillenii]
MLHAILEGKAGRVTITNESKQSWRSVFCEREDLLTAAVWGRIYYLSPVAMTHFISKLLGSKLSGLGEVESIEFWPRYSFPELNNERMKPYLFGKEKYAEPDVVLTYKEAALIIEVKPPEGGLQSSLQWRKEIYTYISDEHAKSRVYFLALGNVPEVSDKWISELTHDFPQVTFYHAEWRRVREILQDHEWQLTQDRRIVEDCLKALALYNIKKPLLPWHGFHNFLTKSPLSNDFSFTKDQQ